MDRCYVCRNAKAAVHCSCVLPALNVCANCIVPHGGTAGTHTIVSIIPKEEVKVEPPGNVNEVCDECGKKPAVLFCLCTYPFKKFCEGCDTLHYQKALLANHSKHPIAALRTITSGQIAIGDFTKKQRYVSDLQVKLSESLASLDTFIVKMRNEFDRVIQMCVKQKEKVERELQEVRQQLSAKLYEADQLIGTKRYEINYEAKTWLEKSLLTGYITTPSPDFILFYGSINIQPLLEALPKCSSYSIDNEVLINGPANKLPVIKGNRVWLYDIPTLNKNEFILQQNTNINGATAYCYIDSATLICCGGDTHNEVYEINLHSLQVSKLNSMSCARRWPGIYKHNEYIYIFGGYGLTSVEKYSLTQKTWNLLDNAMNQPKGPCMICRHSTGIYVTGNYHSSNMTIEMFNLSSEQFRLIYTFANSNWPLAIIKQDLFIIFLGDKVVTTTLTANEPQFISGDIEKLGNPNYWSNCPVVEFGGEFYSVWNAGGSPSGFLKCSPPNQLTMVKSISY